jgi:SNF family Na+-dependent transporter
MVVVCIYSFIFHFIILSFSFYIQAAFLIPYFILYFLIGAPIYYLELALGQFSSRGPATAFILAKGWQGKQNNTEVFSEIIV